MNIELLIMEERGLFHSFMKITLNINNFLKTLEDMFRKAQTHLVFKEEILLK